ncbi:MAG: F0F1 ATP synthase subunit epsilon [Gammaproteobacteria bacterium]
MNTFSIIIRGTLQHDYIDHVISFVGEDNSGSFGILFGHARMMTSLVFGLARFKIIDGPWQYLAVPGAILYFNNNKLTLITRRYLKSDNYEQLALELHQSLLAEEEQLIDMKENIRRLDEEMLKRLRELT